MTRRGFPRFFCRKIFEKKLAIVGIRWYNTREKYICLIKSDGGTGPVKSGNLHLQGANSRSES